MTNSVRNIILVLLSAVVMTSCDKSISDYKTYMKYLSDKDHGLIKDKTVGGVNLKVKYLPLDYLVYNAVKSSAGIISAAGKDSIKKSYSNSMTFMLTIGPDENQSFDIIKEGVANYKEFAQRIEDMSFNMTEYITLSVKDKEYKPELVQLESINGPQQSRNLIVVFKTKDEKNKEIMTEDLCFAFNDEMFYTGISKFKFRVADILALPEFKF